MTSIFIGFRGVTVMKKNKCKKDSNFCTHFIGDIFNREHIKKCYKYCSCCETEKLKPKDEFLKREDIMLNKKVKNTYSIMNIIT